jgi:hypothetical protein
MELSPSLEATSCTPNQAFPNILWNLKVLYHGHSNPPLFPNMSQINPTHITHILSKLHLNIILPPTSRSS